MKGYIHLHDDCNKECVTINVEYITSVANNSYGRAVVRTVDRCKFYVHETQFEVEQKIEAAFKNSSCLDNNDSGEEHHESEKVTCGNCEYCDDIDNVHNLCSVHRCYVTYADSCEFGTRKDQSSK